MNSNSRNVLVKLTGLEGRAVAIAAADVDDARGVLLPALRAQRHAVVELYLPAATATAIANRLSEIAADPKRALILFEGMKFWTSALYSATVRLRQSVIHRAAA